jgi:hypothetical protein
MFDKEDKMRCLVEPIGAQFSNKDLPHLAKRFDQHANEGYRLHTVFQVSQPGCMGIGTPTITYLAVYEKMTVTSAQTTNT